MDVNVISASFAEISNAKDGLFMTIYTKDNKHFIFKDFDLKTREHALFDGWVNRFITKDFFTGKPSMNTRYHMETCAKNGFNLYDSKRVDDQLSYHTKDMLKGFFSGNDYRNSVMCNRSKLEQRLATLKAQNASANRAIAHNNATIANISKQLSNN